MGAALSGYFRALFAGILGLLVGALLVFAELAVLLLVMTARADAEDQHRSPPTAEP